MPCLLCGRSLAYNWAVTRRQVAAGHSEGQCRGAGLRARAHVCTTLHHRPEEALARTHARTHTHAHARANVAYVRPRSPSLWTLPSHEGVWLPRHYKL